MHVLTTAPNTVHARAHHGAVPLLFPQVRIAPAPGSQASGTWYVDPVLRLWHAADGLTRNGRVVKAERVAVSTSANVQPLEHDSVRVLTSGSSSFEIEGEIWIEREGADAAPGPDKAEEAEEAATDAQDADADWQSEDALKCADCL